MSTSTNDSNEPQGGLWHPTDEPYFWNDDIHKDIIDICDRQYHINWECKLEALANCYAPNRVWVRSDWGRTGTQHGDGLGFSGVVCCADSAFTSCISVA